ncbi:MAG: SigB/SigF/SigG family RNA polymerase sigma factor [Acidimicrobiales bacterium]|jgi:RNA polymerase sigma-B factor
MNPPERPPRSTREEFVEFALTRDERLRNELVESHLGLAHQLARRFVSRGETYDDLVQVASLALVKSVDRFDPERGVEFSSFATRTVVGELKRHFRDRGWAIRAPRRIQELYLEIGPAIESLSHDLGRPPTITEMADSIGVAEEAVLEALEAGKSYHLTSIDAQDRKEGTILDRLGDVDAGFDGAEDRLALAISLADLSERQRTILNLRFVDGLTQTEIADRVGVSQMHVSRLLADSLAALRRAFE